MNGLATIGLALLGSGLIAAIPALIGTLRTLKVNQPKTAAEAENAAATANRTDIGALRDIIDGLSAEVARLNKAAAEQRQVIEEERARDRAEIDRLRQELTGLHARIDDYDEQDRLQEMELAAANRRGDAAVEENRILKAHLQVFNKWANTFYETGAPPDVPPPRYYD